MVLVVRTAAIALAVLCLVLAPAAADSSITPLVRPDPATITLPKMSAPPAEHDIKSFEYHYFFYKPGVTYEAAFADFDLCRIYSLSSQLVAFPPKFVPMGDNAARPGQKMSGLQFSQYGLVGMVIAGALIESAEEDNAIATNRRCLFYKGYGRYGTSRSIFNQIADGSDAERLARMALVAAGPPPLTGAIGQ